MSDLEVTESSGLFGAVIGFAIGGPIGAVIGGLIASSSSDNSYRSNSYSYNNYSRSSYVDYETQQRQEEKHRRELERQQQLEDERRQAVQNSWNKIKCELQKQISSIKSSHERNQLEKSLDSVGQSYVRAMNNNNSSSVESLINNLRQDIISKLTDEKLIASKQDEISRFLSELSRKAPVGFANDIKSLRNIDIKSEVNSIEAQNEKISSLMSEAQRLANKISLVNSISIDTLVEETFIIPPVAVMEKSSEETAVEKVSILQDIYDFGGRITFFDEREAEKLKPLIVEAKNDMEISRLKLIRTQVKTTYNRLREQAILTDVFKRDFNDFLPPMRRATGTKELCARMEDLLTAPVISRDDYNEIYKAVKIILSEQLETITDAFFAEKIASTINKMGYNLIDENGNPADLPLNTMRMIEIPYEGYRVRVKVGNDRKVVTRLVRVVGSEEEKASTSEYQRHQDIEIGKKWCKDLDKFYKVLENNGLQVKNVMSKEPGEEPLDIVVDKLFKKQRKAMTAERQQEFLQERTI